MLEESRRTFDSLCKGIEIVSVIKGIKPCCRFLATDEEIVKIKAFCSKYELILEVSDFRIILETDEGKGFSNKGRIVKNNCQSGGLQAIYISKNKEGFLAKLFEAKQDDYNLGLTLGYPKCCCEFFEKNKIEQQKKQNDFVELLINSNNFKTFPWQNNILARYFDCALLAHFPCKFTCAKSIEYSKKVFEEIKKLNEQLAEQIHIMLTCAAVYTEKEGIFLLRNHQVKEDQINFSNVVSTVTNETCSKLIKDKHILKSDPLIKGLVIFS